MRGDPELEALKAEFGIGSPRSSGDSELDSLKSDLFGNAPKLKAMMLEDRWKQKKGRGFTQGERSFVDNEGRGAGPEDLRQHRELLEFLGVSGEEIDGALKESGSYKLEKSAPGATEDKGYGEILLDGFVDAGKKVIRPGKELLEGNFKAAAKEAVMLPIATLSGGVVGGAERNPFAPAVKSAMNLLNAGKEATIGGMLDLSPETAGKAGWKALTEGDEEQQERLDATMTSLGVNPTIGPLGRLSRVTGFFADPLNLPAGGALGKLGKLAGISKVSKFGIESKLAEDVGEGLAKVIGTQEEKWAAQLGKQKGAEVYETIIQKQVQRVQKEDAWVEKVGEAFTNPKVLDVLEKIPFVGRSGAVAIGRTLRNLPMIGSKFGVGATEQKEVFRAIEGIKEVDAAGNLVFGTETRTGSGIPRAFDVDAKATFAALSPAGKRAAKWYVQEREVQKAIAGVESDVEGYIHHFWDEGVFGAGKGKFALTKEKAASMMKRSVDEHMGYVEDAERAIIKGHGEAIGKGVKNELVDELAKHVAEPIPAGGVIPEGYVEIPTLQATRTGKAVRQLGGGKMIRKDLYDDLIRYGEAAKNVGGVKGAIGKLGSFFKQNLLLAPGTAVTNALGGGALFAGRLVENMVKAIALNPKPLMMDLDSIFTALRPSVIEARPNSLWGGKSALFSEIGQSANPITKLMQAGLAPFGAIENYFKRVLVHSELGAKGLRGLNAEQIAANKSLIADLNKTVDTYAMNYDNVPTALKNFRESPYAWAAMPFPTYGYKLARYYSRYGAALNPFIQMSPVDRAARIATLATLGGAATAMGPGKDRKHVKGMTSQVDTSGRTKIGTTPEGKETWLRTVKYPWMGLGQAAGAVQRMAEGGGEEEMAAVAGEFIAEGPLVDGLKVAANIGNRWEVYIPRSVRAGNIARSFVPGMRLTEGVKAMKGGERIVPETFMDAVTNSIPGMGLSGKVQIDRMTKKPVLLDPGIEFWKFWAGVSMKEIDPKRYSREKQARLKSALTAISDATDESKLNAAMERLAAIDPEKMRAMEKNVKSKRLILQGVDYEIVKKLMQNEAAGSPSGSIIEKAREGMKK